MTATATTQIPASQEPEVLDLRTRIGLGEEDKFLSFALGGEAHAMPILMVKEIIQMMRITPLPQSPHHVRGIVNLRGIVIPVIDMRAKFGLEPADDSKRTCIVVVQASADDSGKLVGLVVDQVDEVLNIPANAIEAPPSVGAHSGLHGVGKVGEKVVLIVDVAGLIGEDEGIV